ncbi:2838_t:CDS:2, partial [Ambispora leptoticha]
MGHKGGKPQHPLSEYFYILPNEWANKSNKKCICRACMEAVGKDVALNDESMKLTNTRRYCANHIREYSFFAAKYLPEQIEAILTLAVLPKKHANSPANSSSTSTSIPKKKQTKVLQYIGQAEELNIKANCLVTDSAGAYAAARRYLRNEMRDK